MASPGHFHDAEVTMIRTSGFNILELLDEAEDTGVIKNGGNATNILLVPDGFTGIGEATIEVGYDEDSLLPLYESDGSTAITVTLVAEEAIVLPPEASAAHVFRLTFATALTQDETLVVLNKS